MAPNGKGWNAHEAYTGWTVVAVYMSSRPKVVYATYIRSAEWQAVRERYRASKMPQACVVCGKWQVELHHRTYIRLGRERLTDLMPLCREHHKEAHRIRQTLDKPRGDKGKKGTATTKQIDYIRRLGGKPHAEMTGREARVMYEHILRSGKKKRRKRKPKGASRPKPQQ
jgi:hypothetical protein